MPPAVLVLRHARVDAGTVRRLAGALCLVLASSATVAHAAALFEWIDDRGMTRISDTVPDRYRRAARPIDCASWRKRFAVSRDCFMGFTLPDGSLRPGAAQTCGPDLPNPAPLCGSDYSS